MNDYSDERNIGNKRKKRGSNIKIPPHKIDRPEDKHRKSIPKVAEEDNENPLEDMEIIWAMGMDKCKDCNNLYPLHINRCPVCNNS